MISGGYSRCEKQLMWVRRPASHAASVRGCSARPDSLRLRLVFTTTIYGETTVELLEVMIFILYMLRSIHGHPVLLEYFLLCLVTSASITGTKPRRVERCHTPVGIAEWKDCTKNTEDAKCATCPRFKMPNNHLTGALDSLAKLLTEKRSLNSIVHEGA